MKFGALEAGGTKMVCAVGHGDGTVVESVSMPTTTPAETMEKVADWFAEKGIAALGIGAFGPTAVNPADPRFGQILETPKTAWRYFDMLGSVRDRLNVPCGYDTDVNVACLGEVTFGCAKGLSDVVYLTIGTGVGAGVLSGGKLVHGNMHPEAGHILLVRELTIVSIKWMLFLGDSYFPWFHIYKNDRFVQNWNSGIYSYFQYHKNGFLIAPVAIVEYTDKLPHFPSLLFVILI